MSVFSLAAIGGALLLSSAGCLNLIWMIRRRASPVEFRGCAWMAGALFTAAGALACLEFRRSGTAALLGIAALFFAIAWFAHIYRQSLHNTTM